MKAQPRILIIDDDVGIRRTLSDILRIKGYEAVAAGNGAQGIAEASRAFANLALIDLKLPDMSGLEVMERIKSATPLTEAIILTGHASLDTAIMATDKGAFSYLQKPYQIEDLLLHIRHALDRQQAQEEILRLASFPRLSPNPVIEISSSGDLSYLNPAAERLFPGLAALGMNHALLEGVMELFAVFRNGGDGEILHEVEFEDAIYEQHISHVQEADLIRIHVLDITRRKQAEEALLERQEALAEAQRIAGVGSWELDPKTGAVTWSEEIYRIFGLDPQLPAPSLSGHTHILTPRSMEQLTVAIEKILQTGEPFGIDLELCRPEGMKRWITARGETKRDKSGNIVALRGTALDISERRERELQINQLNARLLAIRNINEYLLTAEDEDGIFRFVCEEVKALENIAAVWIGLKAADFPVRPAAWAGFDDGGAVLFQASADTANPGIMGTTIREGRPLVVADVENDPLIAPRRAMMRERNIRSCAGVPLIAGGEVIGGMMAYSTRPAAFGEETLRFLTEIADDIAIGVRSLRLGKKLEATLRSLRKSRDSTIEAIASMIQLRDPYTAGHERRVAQLSVAIGQEMGLPERQTEGLYVTACLHDIGKIALPADILSKPTALTAIEFAFIRTHAQAGYDILKNLEFPWPVAQAVLQHHERLDGSGYPLGIKGEEIILEARILMVADVVEAMASHRPYRPSLGLEVALGEIASKRGVVYDAGAADACLRLFLEKGFQFQ